MQRTDIEAIASLARLDLTPDELDRFATQFEGILELFRALDAVDTAGASGGSATERHAPLRDDVAAPTLPIDDVLANNPASDASRFLVPKILDDGAS